MDLAGLGSAWLSGLVGLVFESVGDAQLAAYKKDPDRAAGDGPRALALHPAPELLRRRVRVVGHLAGRRPRRRVVPALTIAVARVMTYFLVFATGARLLESSMMKRPGYPEYAERTSMFFPLAAEEARQLDRAIGLPGSAASGRRR